MKTEPTITGTPPRPEAPRKEKIRPQVDAALDQLEAKGPSAPPPPAMRGELKQIKLALIAPSQTNPRKDFNPEKLAELADSLKAQGIRVPLLVRPRKFVIDSATAHTGTKEKPKMEPVWNVYDQKHFDLLKANKPAPGWKAEQFGTEHDAQAFVKEVRFELVDGERRFRAAQSIRLDEVPCIVQPLTDAEAREIQLLSFVRENLSDLEAARGYDDLIKHHGYTAEGLRQKIGLAKATFYGRMSIMKAGKEVLDALAAGEITQSHVQLLVSVPNEAAQKELLGKVTNYPLSVRELKEEIESDYVANLDKAPFDVKAIYPTALLKSACEPCEFRGANCKDKFPGLALRPNACLNCACFKSKVAAKQLETVAALRAKGVEVLDPKESKAVFKHSYSDSPQGGYSRLSDYAHTSKAQKPFSELLGKDVGKAQMVKAWHPDGTLRDIYRTTDLWALLEAKGFKRQENRRVEKAAPPKSETPEAKAKRLAREKALAERAAFEAKVNAAAAERIGLAAVAKAQKEPADVFRILIATGSSYEGSRAAALKRHGLAKEGKKLTAALNGLKLEALAGVLLETRLHYHNGEWDEHRAEQHASYLGVDVKAIRKQVAAELEAAAKTKPEAKPALGKGISVGKLSGPIVAKLKAAKTGKAGK
ncbi:MAG TPA: ParB/RepB/Spo0J family partition protein [Verrucomicrobiae bacterium]|jgi:ParB/RepB/Spo0J family partition protein